MPKTNSEFPRFEVRTGVFGIVTKQWPASVVDTCTLGSHPYPHQHDLVAACSSVKAADLLAELLNAHYKEVK